MPGGSLAPAGTSGFRGGLMGESGKPPWWATAPVGEHAIQARVLVRTGKATPSISRCVGKFWRGLDLASQGNPSPLECAGNRMECGLWQARLSH